LAVGSLCCSFWFSVLPAVGMPGSENRILVMGTALLGSALSACAATPTTRFVLEEGPEPASTLEADSAAGHAVSTEAAPARALPPTTTMADPGWDFAASLYAWLPSKRGVIETSNLAIPLDDPDEATGGFVYFEGERGRWGFAVNLDFLNSEDQVPGLAGPIEVDEDTLIAEIDATFRPAEGSSLQFLAGLRMLDSSQDIRFPILPPTSTDVTQVDPIVGARGTWPLSESFRFRLRGDIGGFGIDSDFTYQMAGLFGWEFARNWSLTGGYRMLGWEFEADGVRNDLRLSGPLLGVAASF